MIVHLIRHGQTNGNVDGFHQGWGDSRLTEKGQKQAEATRNLVSEVKYDRIICSDLLRTRQTCNIIFGDAKNIEYDAKLREINNSVFYGQYRKDLIVKYGNEYIENCRLMNYASYGGESSDSLLERTRLFMQDLEKDTESQNIAVITHGGTIRGLLCYVLDMPLYTSKVKIDNCSVTTLEYKRGEWTLIHFNNRKEI